MIAALSVSDVARDPKRIQAVRGRAGALHMVFDAGGKEGVRVVYYRRIEPTHP